MVFYIKVSPRRNPADSILPSLFLPPNYGDLVKASNTILLKELY
jgi:hypothetical protein